MALPISDILHRGFVLSLATLSAYGLFLGVAVHRETLEKGRQVSRGLDTKVYESDRKMNTQLMARREEESQRAKENELKEEPLAETAQSAFRH